MERHKENIWSDFESGSCLCSWAIATVMLVQAPTDYMTSSHAAPQEDLRLELLSVEEAQVFFPDASLTPSWGGVLGTSHWEEAPGKT